jgi:hypothetical protein
MSNETMKNKRSVTQATMMFPIPQCTEDFAIDLPIGARLDPRGEERAREKADARITSLIDFVPQVTPRLWRRRMAGGGHHRAALRGQCGSSLFPRNTGKQN